ncbi:MAG: ligase-associated DNA damage response DEXH box helicase [Armatimonadetes bacterium]|nr:ligase-associated DNA damage response DEXH box helicase [Armatimonadota bacterium]
MASPDALDMFFESRGWVPFQFQRDCWDAIARGESGLLHSATGTGKTLAVWLGILGRFAGRPIAPGLKVLWITPLRALAHDTRAALEKGCEGLGLPWTVEIRTGDTGSSEKRRQRIAPPDVLVTTPESLAVMLSNADHKGVLSNLEAVVVDEWHELLSTKRGVLNELCMSRVRALCPSLMTWGISATLGNLDTARDVLLGVGRTGPIIRGKSDKETVIDSLLPESVDRFPWAGHLGLNLLPMVLDAIEETGTTLVFTNVRSSTELWHQAILAARPDWEGTVAIHHGSLEREIRDDVEIGLKTGQLRAVVCTSSLDLGVDFSPVDRIIQVGSPKGVARLLQRAGRSGHAPGQVSRVSCVPSHALELVDIASARFGADHEMIEGREPLERPLDVLCQHLVTLATGGGFLPDEILPEIRTAYAYRDLELSEWDWALAFITQGGTALGAYPQFKRVGVLSDGTHIIKDRMMATRHRLNIGTITSEASMSVRMQGGGNLGTVEEGFVARLRPGDTFLFSGKLLEFIRAKELVCYVKKATKNRGTVPRWAGGRMPLSNELAQAIRVLLDEAVDGVLDGPEMQIMAPLLDLQHRWSAVPRKDEFLVEQVQSSEGFHLFFYPIEGRLVHQGLAALWAYRLSKETPITFTMAANDYGLELFSDLPVELDGDRMARLLSSHQLYDDILSSLNATELGRRQFREIARIAGLVYQSYPGEKRTSKQLQTSSSLIHDVFVNFDPENLLLQQSRREVLERQLESNRLSKTLHRLRESTCKITQPPRPTPFAFPILVDRLRESVSSESASDRIERMAKSLELLADVTGTVAGKS